MCYIWSHIDDNDKVKHVSLEDQIALQRLNRDNSRSRIIRGDGIEIDLRNMTVEQAIIEISKDNERLATELEEARKWVPYQKGKSMTWVQN